MHFGPFELKAEAEERPQRSQLSPAAKKMPSYKVVELFPQRNTPQKRTTEINSPARVYDCRNYNTCLSLAAALNWSSFTCTACSGEINQQLVWRAHASIRDNSALRVLCDLPECQSDIAATGRKAES